MTDTSYYRSPIGRILLASRDDALIGLWLEGQKYYPDSLPAPPAGRVDPPILRRAKSWLDRYFAREKPRIDELRLAPAGSDFRQAVWKILCEIPYGATTTYGAIARELARRLHRPRLSAQAVGGAVGHNAVSIIIPCHRVVGAGGSLTGYAGGIEKKQYLLIHENVSMENLFLPPETSSGRR